MSFRLYAILVLLLTLLGSRNVVGQKLIASEKELKEKAGDCMKAEDYTGAAAAYSQLLSLHPDHAEFNYGYGVSLLLSGKDKSKAANFLETASRNPKIDKDVFFYLGRAYAYANKFDEALHAFSQFEQQVGTSKAVRYEVTKYAAGCRVAKELNAHRKDVSILSSQQLILYGFYSVYDYVQVDGKILSTPAQFLSPTDKEKMNDPAMNLTPDDMIFFASYGKNSQDGKDIYRVTKKADGSWGKPENLGKPLNSSSNEDYPFWDKASHTLYFASKGHNTVGGYDIFKSVYLAASNQWTTPENIGLPINSPDDDILYIPNNRGNGATYATNVNSEKARIEVRKIQIASSDMQMVTIQGKFTSTDEAFRKDARISIYLGDQGVVASAQTNERTGAYELTLIPGKEYLLVVEAGGYATHKEYFRLPAKSGEGTWRQDVNINRQDGREKLSTNSYFVPVQLAMSAKMEAMQESTIQAATLPQAKSNSEDARAGTQTKSISQDASAGAGTQTKSISQDAPEVGVTAAPTQEVLAAAQTSAATKTTLAEPPVTKQEVTATTDNGDAVRSQISKSEVPLHTQAKSSQQVTEHEEAAQVARQQSVKYDSLSAAQLKTARATILEGDKENIGLAKAIFRESIMNKKLADSAQAEANRLTREAAQLRSQEAQVATTTQTATGNGTSPESKTESPVSISSESRAAQPDSKSAPLLLAKSTPVTNTTTTDNRNAAPAHLAQSTPAESNAIPGSDPAVAAVQPGHNMPVGSTIAQSQNPNDAAALLAQNTLAENTATQENNPQGASLILARNLPANGSVSSGNETSATEPKASSMQTRANPADVNTSPAQGHSAQAVSGKITPAMEMESPPAEGNVLSADNQAAATTSASQDNPVTGNAHETKPVHASMGSQAQQESSSPGPDEISGSTAQKNSADPDTKTMSGATEQEIAQSFEQLQPETRMAMTSYRTRMQESTEMDKEASTLVSRISSMKPSPERDREMRKANELYHQSIVKWQEAQKDLARAQESDSALQDKLPPSVFAFGVAGETVVQHGTVIEEGSWDTSSTAFIQYKAIDEQIRSGKTETILTFADALSIGQQAEQKYQEESALREKASAETDTSRKKALVAEAFQLKLEADSLQRLSESRMNQARLQRAEVKAKTAQSRQLERQLAEPPLQANGKAPEKAGFAVSVKGSSNNYANTVNTNVAVETNSVEKTAAVNGKINSATVAEAAGISSTGSDKTKKTEVASLSKDTPKPQVQGLPAFEAKQESARVTEGQAFTKKFGSVAAVSMNPALPEGLIFKVQVGAFRAPIAESLFKGIAPVSGETSRAGWIRYCVGVFRAYESANCVKTEMRSSGFRDAFVVAYLNGKRISLLEAYALMRQSTESEKSAYAETRVKELNMLESMHVSVGKNQGAEPLAMDMPQPAAPGTVEFAVQVGVYRSERVPAALTSLQPLFVEKVTDRKYRFTTRHVEQLAVAVDAKKSAVSAGIKDAFIVVYKDGERMIGEKALAIRKNAAMTRPSQAPSAETAAAPKTLADTVYKVQLGAFRGTVPVEVVNVFVSVSQSGITQEKENGLMTYFAGSFVEYDDALKLKNELAGKGIRDAFVVGFSKGVKLLSQEASQDFR